MYCARIAYTVLLVQCCYTKRECLVNSEFQTNVELFLILSTFPLGYTSWFQVLANLPTLHFTYKETEA